MKEGDRVTDGAGTEGRVREVRRIPSPGQGIPEKEEIYVDWLPDLPSPDA